MNGTRASSSKRYKGYRALLQIHLDTTCNDKRNQSAVTASTSEISTASFTIVSRIAVSSKR